MERPTQHWPRTVAGRRSAPPSPFAQRSEAKGEGRGEGSERFICRPHPAFGHLLPSSASAPEGRRQFSASNCPDRSTRWPGTGFTLIELLVVIAIIAILASLLLPCLARSKAAARSAVCKSNLRQVGMALRMYVDDHRAYPPSFQWYRFPTDTNGLSWFTSLRDYVYRPETGFQTTIFNCPEWNFPNKKGDYGYNTQGTDTRMIFVMEGTEFPILGLGSNIDYRAPPLLVRIVPESKVRAPSDMIAVGDNYSKDVSDPNIHVADLGLIWPMVWPGLLHNGGANLVFCDGHVEFARQRLWLAPTDDARRRWNNDNEPHRETWPKGI
jgi:prepilin-type N-terminal cleavage/methylation domain-containing protein/prepilin-type processing-associated H-X9-DG protein